VQGAGATDNGEVRREAKNIFVIVNNRTPKIETIKFGKSRNHNCKKENYAPQTKQRQLCFSL